MLAWRAFLADIAGVKPEGVNILGYVELHDSAQADIGDTKC